MKSKEISSYCDKMITSNKQTLSNIETLFKHWCDFNPTYNSLKENNNKANKKTAIVTVLLYENMTLEQLQEYSLSGLLPSKLINKVIHVYFVQNLMLNIYHT